MYHWTYLLFVIVKCCYLSTLFEIFILCPKIQRWFAEKIVEWKTRENVVVFDFLAVDNFDFTRKIVKKSLGEKLVKMLEFCQNWLFGQKIDFSNSEERKDSDELTPFVKICIELRINGLQPKPQQDFLIDGTSSGEKSESAQKLWLNNDRTSEGGCARKPLLAH